MLTVKKQNVLNSQKAKNLNGQNPNVAKWSKRITIKKVENKKIKRSKQRKKLKWSKHKQG